MVKKIFFILMLLAACKTYSQSSISGTYMIGDKKVSISADEMAYWLIYETDHISDRLQYEENTPENDQIWLVWRDGRQTGTLVLQSGYSSGRYTDYRTGEEFIVKKIQ